MKKILLLLAVSLAFLSCENELQEKQNETQSRSSEELIKGNETPEDVIAMDKLLDFVESEFPNEARGIVLCHTSYLEPSGSAYVKVGTKYFHVTWLTPNGGPGNMNHPIYFANEVSEPAC